MILQDLWWMDYLVPVLLLLIALPLSLYAVIIDIRESRQRKDDQIRAKAHRKHAARHVKKVYRG
ncbi:hypothetical protein SGGMMB4_04480 [Sodalis glossinidius str. 'morsitans']|uniref:Uncharacterized protein n=1 Tax=Sodalis glossinidius (strain morsitans) TaxID=343509 RepID=A0A193QM00_SODGM|nr:hypothetical protein [Sodalis glossinidius]CRL44174.1 hypothetical protein SGGMMB4_01119 [Sodalis glossinidius str. 'morsitans']CRL46133.1 hypothetical protein SGGMMB4_04480 [Sodalis glossinidius str. 'morsitans']